ncbi:MAG TPA: alpha/beta hydrolase [Xanthomonadaceae bacterium]|jgi:phospholipase/carboxylesterase
MNPIDLLDGIEAQTGPAPTWSVIFLHGLGADGNDFVPIVRELLRPGWPAIRFVFPHAPVRPITLNGGARMRGWYDIISLDRLNHEDANGVRTSIAQVEALIAREVARGIPPSRIVLAGFSQGGAIALATGLRRSEPLAGLIALSTYLPLVAATRAEITVAARATPVFMAHGQHDPVIAAAYGTASRDQLTALGLRVEWHEYPMAHQVCAPEIAALSAWLGARLTGG